MESSKNLKIQNFENTYNQDEKILTNAQCNYNGYLKEIVFNNFMFEIGNFLLKGEKMSLRQVNKHFANDVFPLFSLFLNLKNKHDVNDYLPKKFEFSNIFQNFCYVEKLNLENLFIDEAIIKGLKKIFENNYYKIKSLSLINLEYDGILIISELQQLFDQLSNLEEIKIANIGNRDKLFINSERNFKILKMFSMVKTLKIDNIPLKQIIYLIDAFENLENLSIENCSLDEDLSQIEINMNKKGRKAHNLKSLNLSMNGLSSQTAKESLKKILINQKNLDTLILKGLWFSDIYTLNEEFNLLDKLTFLDFTGSKNIFNEINSVNCLSSLKNLRILNLDDSRLEDEDLLKILKNFKSKDYRKLEELHLLRCLITDDSIKNLLDHYEYLQNLKILRLNFNHRITEKGFNLYLDNYHKLTSLRVLNLRNTGISLKYSVKNICRFIIKISESKKLKNNNFEQICIENCQNSFKTLISENIENSKSKDKKPKNINRNFHFINNSKSNKYSDNFRKSLNSEEEMTFNEFSYENSPDINQKKSRSNFDNYLSNNLFNRENKSLNGIPLNLEILELYFCTLYDNDYYSLIENILNTLKANNVNHYLNLKIGLKIFNIKKPILNKVENLQWELYKKYNLIIR